MCAWVERINVQLYCNSGMNLDTYKLFFFRYICYRVLVFGGVFFEVLFFDFCIVFLFLKLPGLEERTLNTHVIPQE